MRMTTMTLALSALALATSAAWAQGPAADRRGEPRTPAVTSVTFDFGSGVKTTFYSDGSVYEDGFDPARMTRLATRPARAR